MRKKHPLKTIKIQSTSLRKKTLARRIQASIALSQTEDNEIVVKIDLVLGLILVVDISAFDHPNTAQKQGN